VNHISRNMFSVGIDKFVLEDIDNDKLSTYALECRVKPKPRYFHKTDDGKQFKYFFDAVESKVNEVYHKSYSKKFKLKIKRCWFSIGNEGAIMVPHNHKNSFFSAVYYPCATDEALNFIHPSPQILGCIEEEHVDKYDEYNSDTFKAPVDTGDLVVFNSMVYHFIDPTERQRVSYAFDTEITGD